MAVYNIVDFINDIIVYIISWGMSLSAVLSIRIDKNLKKIMREIPIDWRREIEEFIRDRVREFLKKQYLEEARRLRKKIPSVPVSSAELIREDRDER